MHPDAEALLAYDHPGESLTNWQAVLTAKAWLGDDLGCFFVDGEQGAVRAVLVFRADRAFQAEAGSMDMRSAPIGQLFVLEVVCGARRTPSVLKADPVR